jgi:hypothetical protein
VDGILAERDLLHAVHPAVAGQRLDEVIEQETQDIGLRIGRNGQVGC